MTKPKAMDINHYLMTTCDGFEDAPGCANKGAPRAQHQPQAPQRRARETPPAMMALNDQALIAYAMGETQVKDSRGHNVNTGRLWEGNHTVNPPQFEGLNRQLQESLARVGSYHGAIDGKFGRGTKRSVQQIEARYNFARDGIAGRQTIAALQVEEASVIALASFQDGRFSNGEKQQINAELADVARMHASLSREGRHKVTELLRALKDFGNITETDAVMGQTIKQLKQVMAPNARS